MIATVTAPSASPQKNPKARRIRRLAFAATLVALGLMVAQVYTAGHIELMFDEAYYKLWSEHLAWGYFDHPPMVAAWIWTSTTLFGASEFGMRALGTLGILAGSATLARIAWLLFEDLETAALASLFWSSMVLIGVGSIVVAPDTPLVMFWMLGLLGLTELWRTQNALWWALIGVAAGFGLLSKFTAAFMGAGVMLAMLAVPSLRRWWWHPAPYLAGALALVIFAPFLAWNAAHDWVTLVKQLGRAGARQFAPGYELELVATQFGLMNPCVFILSAVGLARAAPPPVTRADEARRLLAASIVPAIAYFMIHALHDRVQGNWPAPIYPAVAILAAWTARHVYSLPAQAGPRLTALLGAARRLAAPLGLSVTALAFVQATTGALPLGAADPTTKLVGWRELATRVDALATQEKATYVLTPGYALTSLLSYYGPKTRPVVQYRERIRWIFAPAPPQDQFAGTGLVVSEAFRDITGDLRKRFASVEPLMSLTRSRKTLKIEEYAVYRVHAPIAATLDAVGKGREAGLDANAKP